MSSNPNRDLAGKVQAIKNPTSGRKFFTKFLASDALHMRQNVERHFGQIDGLNNNTITWLHRGLSIQHDIVIQDHFMEAFFMEGARRFRELSAVGLSQSILFGSQLMEAEVKGIYERVRSAGRTTGYL